MVVAADVTSVRKEVTPAMGAKCVLMKSSSTGVVGGLDYMTLTLASYGITNVLAVEGYVHTTDYSIIVEDGGTTAVAAGVLTYTLGAANNDKRRVVVVYGE